MLILELLRFGRLGCSRDKPYIVPINFAYHDRHLYSVAALGQKIETMRANPLVYVEASFLRRTRLVVPEHSCH